jgi:hypothetical protein
MALSSEQALLLAFRAELNETTPLWTFIRRTATGPSEDGTSDRKEEKGDVSLGFPGSW